MANLKRRLTIRIVPEPTLLDIADFELGWLAGILEGEGCFRYSYNDANNLRVIAECVSTDRDVIESIYNIVGLGRVAIKPTYKRAYSRLVQYQWLCTKRLDVRRILYTLRPAMHARRQERFDEMLWAIDVAIQRRLDNGKSLM